MRRTWTTAARGGGCTSSSPRFRRSGTVTEARTRWFLAAAIGLGCAAEEEAPPADGSTGGSSTGGATTQIFEPPPADDTASSDSGSEGVGGEDGLMGECSIWMQ